MAKLKKLVSKDVVPAKQDPGEFSPDDPRNRMIHTGTGPVQNAPKELSTNPHKTNGTPLDRSTYTSPAQFEFEQRLAKK